MSALSAVLDAARAELGTNESPANSNNIKYNTDYYGYPVSGSAYPWCCTFVWWCFREAGAPELFYGGGKTAGCTTLMNYHKKRGQLVTSGYRPGDLVLFNWSGRRDIAEHIGIVETVVDRWTLITIEGNTSVSSDDNGGGVMRRRRTTELVIGAVRPEYGSGEEVTDMTVNELVSIAGTGDTRSDWAAEAADSLVSAGIIGGDGEGNFGWQRPVTREAVAKIVYETVKKLGLLSGLE